jgi:serine-type D-Ala-D-Ala carboxypeptidase/endopeptidase (penicillin-binding protein 4)
VSTPRLNQSVRVASAGATAVLCLWVGVSGCHAAPRPVAAQALPAATSTLQAPDAAARLGHAIDALIGGPGLERSSWGVLVRSLRSGDTLYAANAGKLLMPGSTLKIATLAAAADRLGWDFTFETRLVAAGSIDAGVLNGDLLVVGAGDPSLVAADGMAARVFADWADALKARGIHAIRGRIIGDDNRFDDETLGPGWAWDDLAGRDAVAVSALQYNENVAQVTIAPGLAAGDETRVTIEPPGSGLDADNRIMTGVPGTPPSIEVRRWPGSSRIELSGTLPLGGGPAVRIVSVDNPTRFFATAFRLALIGAGVDVQGPAVDIDDVTGAPPASAGMLLASYRSPPLSTLAVRLMKTSQNLYAESLFKTIGAGDGAPSFEGGRKAIAETLQPWGIETTGIVQVDGSGLSRYNYVTADALVAVLMHVDRDDRLRAPFEAALPIGGRDGTLAARLTGTAADGNARAKSGTLANVRSLAGYVTAADGEPLVFAILANNFGTMPERAVSAIDAIVVELAEFRR